jgi:AmmeMemoRadiSam system protein B
LQKESEYVRPPAVAGLFYPSRKDELAETVEELLKGARKDIQVEIPEKISVIISPHAGYVYSGYTAAHAYSLLVKNQFKTVVVVSPSHREYFDGLSVFSGKAYSTPLGEIKISCEVRDKFLQGAGGLAVESQLGHRTEHAIEVQLPFLQLTLGNFELVPIVMGDQKREYCKGLGNILRDIAKDNDLLMVASSDLSHYYDYDTANAIDSVCVKDITELEPGKMMDDLENRRCEACGGGPIVSCMYAAKDLALTRVSVLHHCNSGDTSGDKSAVVGYLSAIIS